MVNRQRGVDIMGTLRDLVHRVGVLERKTPVTGGGGGAVDSVNGQTGVVVLTATDVGADPTGAAAAALATAEAHTIGDGTYTTGGGTLGSDPVIDVDIAAVLEYLMDYLGTTGLVQGTNMTLTYNDGAGTITFDSTGGSASVGSGYPLYLYSNFV